MDKSNIRIGREAASDDNRFSFTLWDHITSAISLNNQNMRDIAVCSIDVSKMHQRVNEDGRNLSVYEISMLIERLSWIKDCLKFSLANFERLEDFGLRLDTFDVHRRHDPEISDSDHHQ